LCERLEDCEYNGGRRDLEPVSSWHAKKPVRSNIVDVTSLLVKYDN